jgi:hypothetical protein
VQVGSIVNFSLMYLLAPTAATASAAGAAAGSSSLLARLLSDDLLLKWGAPGGNMFQPGFPLHKRLLNFGYKGAIFAVIGMMAGTVGTSVSNGLLALRKRLDPTFAPQNEPPPVLGNAACWALHMGLSSNLRYQMLGGADGVSASAAPCRARRCGACGARCLAPPASQRHPARGPGSDARTAHSRHPLLRCCCCHHLDRCCPRSCPCLCSAPTLPPSAA